VLGLRVNDELRGALSSLMRSSSHLVSIKSPASAGLFLFVSARYQQQVSRAKCI